MTAKTEAGALAIETARGDEYRAQLRAEGFRAGAEAMREAAEKAAGDFLMLKTALPVEKICDCADIIRALPIPEDRT